MVAGQRRRREMRGFAVRNGSSRMRLSSSSGASSSGVVSVKRGLVADGPVVPAPICLQRQVSQAEVTAHPDGIQQGLGDAGARNRTRKGDGERLPGKGGDGIGILVDVFVAEVEGGGGDVHGLVGHVVGGRRSGEGARKRAFL